MVRVVFAPGCYGNYILSCLCNYTTLMPNTFISEYDDNGSSHYFRKLLWKHLDLIKLTHAVPKANDIKKNDKMVVIHSDNNHILDYINNQVIKNNYSIEQIFSYLLPDETDKLRIGWNCSAFGDAPTWMLREFISLNIKSIMNNYDAGVNKVKGDIAFSTDDIFSNFLTTFCNTSHALEVSITASLDEVEAMHENFMLLQLQHNIQIRCNSWVDDILSNRNTKTPCTTIFDEAYVQHRLRDAGYELKCDSVDIFPIMSGDVVKLLYKL